VAMAESVGASWMEAKAFTCRVRIMASAASTPGPQPAPGPAEPPGPMTGLRHQNGVGMYRSGRSGST
jgi:hypothetical protein